MDGCRRERDDEYSAVVVGPSQSSTVVSHSSSPLPPGSPHYDSNIREGKELGGGGKTNKEAGGRRDSNTDYGGGECVSRTTKGRRDGA